MAVNIPAINAWEVQRALTPKCSSLSPSPSTEELLLEKQPAITQIAPNSVPSVFSPHVKFENSVASMNATILEIVARLFFENHLVSDLDKVPLLLRPKKLSASGQPNSIRCCVHKDRAMIRYRLLATMGFQVEKDDEMKTLGAYAQEALQRKKEDVKDPVITVLEDACHRCSKQQYVVTDACQGCFAEPCRVNCPKGAISKRDGRSVIDSSKCIRCGKCEKVCPYRAIVNIPIPCVSVCPVGAITPLPDGRKEFNMDKCIFCGSCQRACPFGAVMPRSHIVDVMRSMVDPNQKVVALLAPAILGHTSVDFPTLVAGLKAAGFTDVLDVSVGADDCAQEEAAELPEHIAHGKHPFMTTSCCPAYIRCIKTHIQEIEEAVSATPTPLHFSAVTARKMYPDATIVFVGPCVAKRHEAIIDTEADFALTFNEIFAILAARDIDVKTLKVEPVQIGSKEGRGFAVVGGVTAAAISFAPAGAVKPILINGLSPNSVKLLKSFAKKAPNANLVEVMACEGGCVAGPGSLLQAPVAAAKVKVAVAGTAHHPKGKPDCQTPFVMPQ